MSISGFLSDVLKGPSVLLAEDIVEIKSAQTKVLDAQQAQQKALEAVVEYAHDLESKVNGNTYSISRQEQKLQTIEKEVENEKKAIEAITPGCDMTFFVKRLDRMESSIEDIRKIYVEKVDQMSKDLATIRKDLEDSKQEFRLLIEALSPKM